MKLSTCKWGRKFKLVSNSLLSKTQTLFCVRIFLKIINNYFLSHSLSLLIRPDADDSDIKGKNLIYEANVQKQKSVSQKLNSSKNLPSLLTVAAMTGSSVSNGLQNGNSANGTAATVNGCWTVGLINRYLRPNLCSNFFIASAVKYLSAPNHSF